MSTFDDKYGDQLLMTKMPILPKQKDFFMKSSRTHFLLLKKRLIVPKTRSEFVLAKIIGKLIARHCRTH